MSVTAANNLNKPRMAAGRRSVRSSRAVRRRGASVTASAADGAAGKCWLVGSGPGAPDLLTIRAARLLEKAEVLIYDELGAEGLLDEYASPDSRKVYVGKRGGRQSITQKEINALLVDACLEGRRVVRLKGGCPAIELVPGISSALSAPLFAGFPLTQKDIGRHFVVTSAHSPDKLNWEHLSAIDTIVILMGGAKIPDIVTRLKAAGRDPSTPVCIIRWAGTDKQQVWRGCIDNIVDITQGESLSPCIIVVGQVAGSV
eukprot:jgi/Tetstr1/434255/TSEL_023362.t1